MKYCTCEDWEQNINKVDSIFLVSHIHGVDYDGEYFKCCPWCGNKLLEQPKVEITINGQEDSSNNGL